MPFSEVNTWNVHVTILLRGSKVTILNIVCRSIRNRDASRMQTTLGEGSLCPFDKLQMFQYICSKINIITARKRSLGQGNIFRSVCQELFSESGKYLGRYPLPQPGTPPGPGTPPQDQVHPAGTRYTPQTRYTPRTRYIPPPGTPPTRYTPPDQVPPLSSACWEIWATGGWYASYLNAFLLHSVSKRIAKLQ